MSIVPFTSMMINGRDMVLLLLSGAMVSGMPTGRRDLQQVAYRRNYGFCRGAKWYYAYYTDDRMECKESCSDASECTAYEYNPETGSCELFDEEITRIELDRRDTGTTCVVKTGGGDDGAERLPTKWRIVNLSPIEDHWNVGELALYAKDSSGKPIPVPPSSIRNVLYSANYDSHELSVLYDGDFTTTGHANPKVWAGADDSGSKQVRGSWVGYELNAGLDVVGVKVAQMAEGFPGFQSSETIGLEYMDSNGDWQAAFEFEAKEAIAYGLSQMESAPPAVVVVYEGRHCSGKKKVLYEADFVGGRFSTGWDACGETWDDGSDMSYKQLTHPNLHTWLGSYEVQRGFTISTSNRCHDDFHYPDKVVEDYGATAADGCREVYYDFNYIEIVH